MRKLFIVALIVLSLAFTTVDAKAYTKEDVELVARVIELENPDGSELCKALTGIALVNRSKYCPWCPSTIKECIFQKSGKYWQYASDTREKLYTVKVRQSTIDIAKNILDGWYKGVPKNMIYQGMKLNGTLFTKCGTEYFGIDTTWSPGKEGE